jgi:hypothetical protein
VSRTSTALRHSAQTSQPKPVELQDAIHVREPHLDLTYAHGATYIRTSISANFIFHRREGFIDEAH